MNVAFRILAGVSLASLAVPAIAVAAPRAYDIAAQPMASALQQFALQSGSQIAFSPEISDKKFSKSVAGSFEADEALQQLLEGSNLIFRRAEDGYVITLASKVSLAVSKPPVVQPPAERVRVEPEVSDLQDIVVTAQKREQNIRDVSIAISAFTGNQLAARNVTDIQNTIGNFAPNVKIVKVSRTTSAQIAIRGAVTGNPALYWEPTVGIYMDGIYIGKNVGNVFSLPDVERIEVLRGPQGTLYGRNTLAGAVNIVMKKPSGEFGGFVDLGVGDYGARTARASLDLPRVGPLSIKLTGQIQKRDGFVKIKNNPYPNVLLALPPQAKDLDDLNSKTGRVAAHLEISDDISADYSFQYDRAEQRPQSYQVSRVAKGGIFDPASPRYAGGLQPNGTYTGLPLDLYVRPGRSDVGYSNGSIGNAPQYENATVQSHTGVLTWDLSPMTLKSITGYRKMNWKLSHDLDGTPLNFASIFQFVEYESFSQEWQATGKLTENLQGSFGLYYFKDSGSVYNPQQFFNGAVNLEARYGIDTRAYAAYGQLEYRPPILDQGLTLIGGIRYGRETKNAHRSVRQVATGLYTIPLGTRGKKSFSAITPMATVRYDLSDNANVYARYARGFKSGGFNLEAPTVAETLKPFDDELLDEFEVGTKIRTWGGRLTLNVAAFWDMRKNMQLSVFVPSAGSQSVVRNAGKADVRGLEIEGQFLPTSWLRFNGSMGLLDTKYSKFIDGGVNVAKDRAFPYASKFTASLSTEATIAKTQYGNVRVIIDYSHSSPYFVSAFSKSVDPNLGQNAYTSRVKGWDLVDPRISLTDIPIGDGSAELSIWAKNIFNEEYASQNTDYGASFGGMMVTTYGNPRTYGMNISYRW